MDICKTAIQMQRFATDELEERHHVRLAHRMLFQTKPPRWSNLLWYPKRSHKWPSDANRFLCVRNQHRPHSSFSSQQKCFHQGIAPMLFTSVSSVSECRCRRFCKTSPSGHGISCKEVLPFLHAFTASDQRFSFTKAFTFSVCLGLYQSEEREASGIRVYLVHAM